MKNLLILSVLLLSGLNGFGQEKIDSLKIKKLFNSFDCPKGWNVSMIQKDSNTYWYKNTKPVAWFSFTAKERYFELLVFDINLLTDSTFNYNIDLAFN